MTTEGFPDSLGPLLAGLQRLIRRRLRSNHERPLARGAQIELLRLVVDRPGISVSDAARELYLAGNSVSTLVNQLGRAGFLTRETDPDDRRSARLMPSAAAEARVRDWETRRAALVSERVALLSEADQAALAAAVPALRRLADGLREEVEGV
ncbi:MarR family winged helix-turn-helix transcriptional regulator [Streptomyces sp. NPDC050560]|uniref:MarR family winged helix-turn-helix transcriptional regulator n=1 Tax=Streptomyces sp. NPDC050560 TaxID=3365630 RepID=UPI0037A4AD81